jgi:lipid II:glycine glycyltransferase (peptidoglycan interpeptide bridge formation enzyme)
MAILFPKRNKMATTVERLGIVETKVENLNEKMDNLKIDVKEMHDCLDKTRDDIKEQLKEMYDASCIQHAALSKEISAIKTQRDKLIWTFAGVVAAGGFFAGHADKLLGLFT